MQVAVAQVPVKRGAASASTCIGAELGTVEDEAAADGYVYGGKVGIPGGTGMPGGTSKAVWGTT